MGRKRSKDPSDSNSDDEYIDEINYEKIQNDIKRNYDEEEEFSELDEIENVNEKDQGLFSDAGTDSELKIPSDRFWAYLIVNFDKKKKIHTYIGKSRDPVKKCFYWNKNDLKVKKESILSEDSNSEISDNNSISSGDKYKKWKEGLLYEEFSDNNSRDYDMEKNSFNKRHGMKSEEKKQANLSPCWQIEMIIGPFATKDESVQFKEEWKLRSRGIKPRRKKGEKLADEYGKIVYDKRILSKKERVFSE
jgi:hypothetical protein